MGLVVGTAKSKDVHRKSESEGCWMQKCFDGQKNIHTALFVESAAIVLREPLRDVLVKG